MKISNGCVDRQSRGFTITDLLVIIVTLAVLAVVVMPALAGVQNKGGRLECANNLRQMGSGSMIFASDNNGVLPICTVGSGNAGGQSNHLESVAYTYYIFSGTSANESVPTNASPAQGSYQNEGYLYQAGLAGNGSIFYCPGRWGDKTFGPNSYTPLLTTDGSDFVRSSYYYNPRLQSSATSNLARRYQTTSQMEPQRLFAMDLIITSAGDTGAGFSLAATSHARDQGWNVLFTDGSVRFCRVTRSQLATMTTQLIVSETPQSAEQFDEVFDWLEMSH
jgi:Tfp pilus assembly protein PilE